MKWLRDRSGRFEQRPFYDQYELDAQCEEIVDGFLRSKNGVTAYPITTDDLTVMIERDVAELDLYANLAGDGRGVEGVTEFRRRRKPSVRIAKYLSASAARENRLRSTLAHEYAHVVFHGFLWTLEGARPQARTDSAALPALPAVPRRRRASDRLDGVAGRLRGRRAADADHAAQGDGRGRAGRIGRRQAGRSGHGPP